MNRGTTTSVEHHVARKHIAALLHDVADPEIPVVSIVDLGMVIDIKYVNHAWQIELAPTYSGCPAIDVIPMMVDIKLKEAGFHNVTVAMNISPPWSTDWISDEGKQKLFQYGISPPNRKDRSGDEEGRPAQCPQCSSTDTEIISRFSSTPCKAAYRCNTCLEPFEYFKCY